MPQIFVVCPYTCREIPTGIEIDEVSFKRLPDVLTRSQCPHCGLHHDWMKRDARLARDTFPSAA